MIYLLYYNSRLRKHLSLIKFYNAYNLQFIRKPKKRNLGTNLTIFNITLLNLNLSVNL